MSVNQAIIVGNVGKEPDVKSSQSGKEMVFLTVATSETWKDKATGERKEKTEWHNVAIFSESTANYVKQNIRKGSKVFILGTIRTNKFKDKDGNDKYNTQIVVDGVGHKIELLSEYPAKEEANQTPHNQSKSNGYAPKPANDTIDDFVPF